jgi:hypothetical protein
VKPLAKNQQALSFTFGGPLILYSSAEIPIPFTTLGYARGLSNACTVYGNIHTTSLLFGNAQADIGATFRLFEKENRFGFSASSALQLAYSVRNQADFRLWPSADLNTYFHPGKKPSYLYAGFNSWFDLSKYKAYDQPQQRHAIPNLHIGYIIVRTKWQHQFEMKYLGLGIPNTPNVVNYVGISGMGALGIYYSLVRKF